MSAAENSEKREHFGVRSEFVWVVAASEHNTLRALSLLNRCIFITYWCVFYCVVILVLKIARIAFQKER